jgi:hypothetical protein
METIATQGSKYHVGFHKLPLMASWLVLANITMIVGALKWQKWSFYIHAVIGLTMIGLTLSATLHVLFEVGIGYNPTRRFQILHNTVGLVVVIWLGIQLILGMLSRILVYSVHVDPRMVQWIKRAHKVSSYVITGMAKFEYTIIYYRRGKYEEILSFMLFDCICLAIYCWVKFKYPTLSQTIIESQLK